MLFFTVKNNRNSEKLFCTYCVVRFLFCFCLFFLLFYFHNNFKNIAVWMRPYGFNVTLEFFNGLYTVTWESLLSIIIIICLHFPLQNFSFHFLFKRNPLKLIGCIKSKKNIFNQISIVWFLFILLEKVFNFAFGEKVLEDSDVPALHLINK